ncbi:MAG: hypothetical protein HY681_11460 [Chloroflexi bacterium]|nr:hypothetical protein [Chloroflexota bacterium]
MIAAKELDRKLYYFSVYYGEASRILNWKWDRDLALIYAVTLYAHQQLTAGLQLMLTPRSPAVSQVDAISGSLTESARELAKFVEENGNPELLTEILGRIAEIAYAATGNGRYLVEKGVLQV